MSNVRNGEVRLEARDPLIIGLAACLAAALLAGCGGSTGPAGAAGQTGATGPAGAAGKDGKDGQAGQNGQNGQNGQTGPQGPAGPVKPPRLLDDRIPGWRQVVRDAINQLIVDKGIASATWDPKNRPVAAFDWDNTMMKNDAGDATMFYMIAHDKVLQPAGKDWSTTNSHLTAAANAALNAACDGLAAAGAPLPTSTSTACANELFMIYDSGTTEAGVAAWTNQITLTQNQPYAWVGQLQAGYSPEEIRDIAMSAVLENAYAAQGDVQTLGTHTGVTHWVRIYDQMRDLVETLQENGFDVWIVTASPQFVIEPVAELVNVPRDHVLGIRTTLVGGKTTAILQGCGGIADGVDAPITFDTGKRCWINKVIFHEPDASQLAVNPDPAKRPTLSAGDSDTDIAFVKDATGLKLAINRNKMQLMCNAYSNYQGKWFVQPMFISPKPQKVAGYDCPGAKDAAGNSIVDEAGQGMAFQVDSVY
jgi:hypothetical protein